MDPETTLTIAPRARGRQPIRRRSFRGLKLEAAVDLTVGAERFSPIATVVIGGILAATLLTLVVVPVLFRLLERIAPTREDRFAAGLEA